MPDPDPLPSRIVAEQRPLASLLEIARLFLRLGATSFGGPAAHIAMMEREVVVHRSWLSREAFLDLLGATNLIPGPNSTEMAIHIGRTRAGWPGLLVAGTCFITPSVLITLPLAWAYVEYGSRPEVGGLLYGIMPVMIAIVAQALWRLGRQALKSRVVTITAVLAAIMNALGVHELVILLGAGGFLASIERMRRRDGSRCWSSGLLSLALAAPAGAAAGAPLGLLPLFLFFLKVGSILYGSGYVLLAFLRADLVERWAWLTDRQLLDAIAIGQVTPGPVFSTATFIGYILGRAPGAGLATLGIFLPSFLFVAASGPLIPRIRRSPIAGAFLDGVNAASLALMMVVTWELGRTALVDPLSIAMAICATILLFGPRINSAWLILAGALVGLVLRGS